MTSTKPRIIKLMIGSEPHQVHAVRKHGHENRSNDSATDAALAAAQRTASEDGGGNRLQRELGAKNGSPANTRAVNKNDE